MRIRRLCIRQWFQQSTMFLNCFNCFLTFLYDKTKPSVMSHFYLKHERKFLFLYVILFQMLGYFLLNELSRGTERTLMLPLDNLLPFIPAFSLAYVAMYFMGFLPFFTVRNTSYLRKVALGYIILGGISFLIFALFPVKMIRPDFAAEHGFELLVSIIYHIDLPYNTFPSLHVIQVFFAALVVRKVNKRAGNYAFLLAVPISLSTLLIKQHYVLDLAAGLLIAVVGYLVFARLVGKASPKQ